MTFTVYVIKLFKTFGSADRIEPHESLTFIFISTTGSLMAALFFYYRSRLIHIQN